MSLQREEYEQFADQVVESFASKKEPLNGSILKIAKENDLNPDQVKRLVEMSNTKAFLKLFKDPENKEKNIEFDVADADHVLKDYYKPTAGGSGGKTVSITKITISGGDDFHSDIPDMMHHKRHGAPEARPVEKTAEELDASYLPAPNREVAELRLRKVAQQFTDKIYDLEHDYQDGLEKVAASFKKTYGPSYGEFEKTALHVHGAGILTVLEDIRGAIRHTAPMYDLEKAASRVFVDDDTPEHKLLAQMVTCKYEQMKCAKAASLTKSKLRSLR